MVPTNTTISSMAQSTLLCSLSRTWKTLTLFSILEIYVMQMVTFLNGINLQHRWSQLRQLCLTWLQGFYIAYQKISLRCVLFYIFIIIILLWCLCPYSGNHERDWPGTGSFYENMDSGGECGVLAQTMFYTPASNRAKVWYDNMTSIWDDNHWNKFCKWYDFSRVECLSSVGFDDFPWLGYEQNELLRITMSFKIIKLILERHIVLMLSTFAPSLLF